MLFATGDLSRAPVKWTEFLSLLGENPARAEQRFIARNFLLDEGVGADRARSYLERGANDGYASADDWFKSHNGYLADVVHRPPVAISCPGVWTREMMPAPKLFGACRTIHLSWGFCRIFLSFA